MRNLAAVFLGFSLHAQITTLAPGGPVQDRRAALKKSFWQSREANRDAAAPNPAGRPDTPGSGGHFHDFVLHVKPEAAMVACPSERCRARIGEKVFEFGSAEVAEVGELVGSGAPSQAYFYVDGNGVLSFGYDGSAVTGAKKLSKLIGVSGVMNFPANVLPIGTCKVQGNRFGSCTDYQAMLSRVVIDPGAGIVIEQNPVTGHTLIGLNPASVGLLGAPNTWSNVNDFSLGTIVYTTTFPPRHPPIRPPTRTIPSCAAQAAAP